jgi:hypothetical protein
LAAGLRVFGLLAVVSDILIVPLPLAWEVRRCSHG